MIPLTIHKGDTGMDPASERLRQVLTQLDTSINGDTGELIRMHLAENQNIVRDLQESYSVRCFYCGNDVF